MSDAQRASLFDDRDERTFAAAVDAWGIDAQADMAEEECAELIVASIDYERRVIGRAELVDELADVRIMHEQLAIFIGEAVVASAVEEARENRNLPTVPVQKAVRRECADVIRASKHWAREKISPEEFTDALARLRVEHERLARATGRSDVDARIREKMGRLRERLPEGYDVE